MKKVMSIAMMIAIAFGLMTTLSYAKGMEKKGDMTHSFHGVKETIGWEVRNKEGEKLGAVENFIYDESGRLTFAVVAQGGMAGIAEKKIVVPYKSLSYGKEADHFVLNETRDRLASAPEFKGVESFNREFAHEVYRYFGIRPHWMEKGMKEGKGMKQEQIERKGTGSEKSGSSDQY